MNSMFLYADVILSLDIQLPTGPASKNAVMRDKRLDMAGYYFKDFLDITQFWGTRWKNKGPQKYDVILTKDGRKVEPNSADYR